MIATAPAKVLLLGEYAVLEQGRALVAAVNRRAIGRFQPTARTPSGLVASVQNRARAMGVLRHDLRIEIDTSAFRGTNRRKLGIGSSAAAAVVTAGLALGEVSARTEEVALLGHRDAAGGVGSGVDVAACFRGGVLAAGRQPSPSVSLHPSLAPLHVFVLFTGASASTVSLVGRCRAAPSWSAHVETLSQLAEAGISSWGHQDETAFLDVVRAYHRTMAALGRDAGAPVVTDSIEAIVRAAEDAGGAAKPSGAGGGDIVVAFGEDPGLGVWLANRCGVDWLDLEIDSRGLELVRQTSAPEDGESVK